MFLFVVFFDALVIIFYSVPTLFSSGVLGFAGAGLMVECRINPIIIKLIHS